MSSVKPINVLLVEDNPADVKLIQIALKQSKINLNLVDINDGESAINYLNKSGIYSSATKPDIILLDLNIPKMDGKEVLQYIKFNNNLKTIPVVIMTSSEAEEDIMKSYRLHANSYVRKPVEWDQFQKIVLKLSEFWFSIVKLPSNGTI